jgi:hypothetical protein
LVGRDAEEEVIEDDVEDGQLGEFEGFEDVVGGVFALLELGGDCAEHFAQDVVEEAESQLVLEVDLRILPVTEDLTDQYFLSVMPLQPADVGEQFGLLPAHEVGEVEVVVEEVVGVGAVLGEVPAADHGEAVLSLALHVLVHLKDLAGHLVALLHAVLAVLDADQLQLSQRQQFLPEVAVEGELLEGDVYLKLPLVGVHGGRCVCCLLIVEEE